MSKVLVTDTNLTNIANAIRSQNGTNTTYKPGEMASAILAIETKEDLSAELAEQETLINNQVIKVTSVRTALQSKIASSESDVEDLSTELTQQDDLITIQTSTLNELILKLQNKTSGGITPNPTNLFDGTKLTFTNSSKVTTTTNSIIFDNSATSSATYYSSQNVSALGLKPSTVYSSRCNVTIEVVTSGGGTAGTMAGSLWLQNTSTYTSNTKYSVLGNNSATGVVYSTFVTPSDLTGFNYLVNRTTGYCKTKFENIVLLEGAYDSGNFPV